MKPLPLYTCQYSDWVERGFVTNTLAYLSRALMTKRKKFYNMDHRSPKLGKKKISKEVNALKNFTSVTYSCMYMITI
jgi:hypothetical protein